MCVCDRGRSERRIRPDSRGSLSQRRPIADLLRPIADPSQTHHTRSPSLYPTATRTQCPAGTLHSSRPQCRSRRRSAARERRRTRGRGRRRCPRRCRVGARAAPSAVGRAGRRSMPTRPRRRNIYNKKCRRGERLTVEPKCDGRWPAGGWGGSGGGAAHPAKNVDEMSPRSKVLSGQSISGARKIGCARRHAHRY